MDRRQFLRAAGAAACASTAGVLSAGCTGAFGRRPPKYQNPVFEPILADPTVTRATDGAFYAYGTEDDWRDGEGPRLVPIVRSTNLVEWEYVGEAFASRPDWKDDGGIWAPEITRQGGRYVLYYSLSVWGDPNPGIGVATADSPEGPFEDRGKLFTSEEIGVPNSIDPFYFEEDGTKYLFWGSFHGIYGVELSSDGMRIVGEKFQIAGDRFEAPYILKRDGSYYFFGSVGSCCEGPLSTYHVEVGRADRLAGPYRSRAGRDLSTFPGNLVVEGSDAFVGPGHNTMVTDADGTEWLLYHAYEEDHAWIQSTPRRCLMLDPLVWNEGWPSVEGRIPSTERVGPNVRAE
jgi:arabinan endo-1,5-alpha-L-arabinosidase